MKILHSRKTVATLAATLTAAALVAIPSGVGQAATVAPAPAFADYTIVFPVTGESIHLDGTPAPMPAAAKSAAVVTPDLNPITIGECNIGLGNTVIESWATSKFGKIDLKCGDSNSGYVHIRSRHQADWQGVINTTHGSGNWDDFMASITGGALTGPSPGYPLNEGSNKWCYTTPTEIFYSGDLIYTFFPTIIVSANNKLVITSFPTHATPNCTGS